MGDVSPEGGRWSKRERSGGEKRIAETVAWPTWGRMGPGRRAEPDRIAASPRAEPGVGAMGPDSVRPGREGPPREARCSLARLLDTDDVP